MDKRSFYTKSGRKISYYGIDNFDDLFQKLLLSYSKETVYPSWQNDYDYDSNPTYGQCAITAMVVNDIFGGTIHKIRIENGTHYFNKINGNYVDLTRDQFDIENVAIQYEPNEEVSKEYCCRNEDTKKRYDLLVEKLKEYEDNLL